MYPRTWNLTRSRKLLNVQIGYLCFRTSFFSYCLWSETCLFFAYFLTLEVFWGLIFVWHSGVKFSELFGFECELFQVWGFQSPRVPCTLTMATYSPQHTMLSHWPTLPANSIYMSTHSPPRILFLSPIFLLGFLKMNKIYTEYRLNRIYEHHPPPFTPL